MRRNLRPDRRTVLAAIVGVLAAGAVYAIGLAFDDPDPIDATNGTPRTFTFTEGEAAQRSVSFTASLELAAEPDAYAIDVAVPYEIDVTPDDADGTRYDLRITVDGHREGRYVLGPGPGDVSTRRPGPLFDATQLDEGENTIRATITLDRPDNAEGRNEITVGPLVARAEPHDGDPDGIPNPVQPSNLFPTTALAVLTATTVGAATYRFVPARGEGDR
jgi:hypothetical protein